MGFRLVVFFVDALELFSIFGAYSRSTLDLRLPRSFNWGSIILLSLLLELVFIFFEDLLALWLSGDEAHIMNLSPPPLRLLKRGWYKLPMKKSRSTPSCRGHCPKSRSFSRLLEAQRRWSR